MQVLSQRGKYRVDQIIYNLALFLMKKFFFNLRYNGSVKETDNTD